MYTAYYDASGTQGDRGGTLTIAGVVSTLDEWEIFDSGWERVLSDFSVPCLHMNDYAQSKNDYEGWRDDKDKRAQFLRQLIDVLQRALRTAFVVQMRPGDFHEANKHFELI